MIRSALLLILAACGTRQAPTSTPDATPDAARVATPAVPATLDVTRTPPTPTVDVPEAPGGVTAITGLLSAHHTDDLPEQSTLDAHDDALESLVWVANHGDVLAVRGRAMHLLGNYDDESAIQTQRSAVEDMDGHPIIVASAIRGLTARGLDQDGEVYALILKRGADTDLRVAQAVAHASDTVLAP